MKKTLLALLVTVTASSAFSKELIVVCAKQNPSVQNIAGSGLTAVIGLANINSTPILKELYIDGVPASEAVISQSDITKDTINLSLQFGNRLYSTAGIALKDYQDSFSATGQAKVNIYVGGFAGTTQKNLICTCELK